MRKALARCHPGRPHAGRGLCSQCYFRAHARGLPPLPDRGPGCSHEPATLARPGMLAIPAACPHCHNPCLRHHEGAAEVNCTICGWEGALRPPSRGKP
jgi:hypothetical protein